MLHGPDLVAVNPDLVVMVHRIGFGARLEFSDPSKADLVVTESFEAVTAALSHARSNRTDDTGRGPVINKGAGQ